MSSERDQNGPTQVQTALYNELTSHMQLNGLNGMNGIGMISKPFGERGKLLRIRFKIRKLPQTLQISLNKISSTSRWKIFTMGNGHARNFPHLATFAFSSNGSNCTVTRLTPLKFNIRICFETAAKIPPDRLKVPL